MLSDIGTDEENTLLDTILDQRVERSKMKLIIKVVIAVILIIMAILLPQLIHVFAGNNSGVKWMPIFLPILLAGCLYGIWWGLGIGIATPIISFAISSIWKKPMPPAKSLALITPEAAVFGLVSGLFSRKIEKNKWIAFPAVLLAQLSGIIFYLILSAIFQGVTKVSAKSAWDQVELGMVGNFFQAVLVPFITIGIRMLIKSGTTKYSYIP